MRHGLCAWALSAPASGPRSSGRRHAQHRDGSAGAVATNSSGRATLVEMAPTRALPPQDGQLMLQGDEFELQ